MKHNNFEKVQKSVFENSTRQKRKCLITDCPNFAIQSHVIQRKGVLNHIITNGHLYEVVFFQFPKHHYRFKKIGWKDALTFNGLCTHHDSKIFEQIEKGSINFSDYKSLLLLAYRPLLREYRLKEIIIDAFKQIQLNKEIGHLMNPMGMRIFFEAQDFMKWDIEFMILCLLKDLDSNYRQYHFEIFTLPKHEICTSTIYSVNSLANSFKKFPVINVKNKELMGNMLFHIIPTETDMKVIFGYHLLTETILKPKIDFFKTLNTEQQLKMVSDILIRSCGSWACSEFFFNDKIKKREKKLLSLMNYFVLRKQFTDEKIEFNIFD